MYRKLSAGRAHARREGQAVWNRSGRGDFDEICLGKLYRRGGTPGPIYHYMMLGERREVGVGSGRDRRF